MSSINNSLLNLDKAFKDIIGVANMEVIFIDDKSDFITEKVICSGGSNDKSFRL